VGDANRAEYITGASERKQVLASIKTFNPANSPRIGLQILFPQRCKLALTNFFDLSNIRRDSGGAGANVWGLAMFSYCLSPIRRAFGDGSPAARFV
jgi:hypothetical protein